MKKLPEMWGWCRKGQRGAEGTEGIRTLGENEGTKEMKEVKFSELPGLWHTLMKP